MNRDKMIEYLIACCAKYKAMYDFGMDYTDDEELIKRVQECSAEKWFSLSYEEQDSLGAMHETLMNSLEEKPRVN
jgi:hypothetical protein